MSNLKKIDQQLAQTKSVKEALSLGFVKDVFIKNFAAITGRQDGENRYASEVFHYLEIVNENEKLKSADKFSHFAAIVKAGTTGLSFGKEGQLYPILYGDKVKVQIGAHGKRELLRRMPNVKMVSEGQVILKGDTFKHDKLNNRLIEHIVSEKQPSITLDNILAAYFRITWVDNTHNDVVVYHDEIVKAKSKSKMQSEQSTWNQWPGQMSCKLAYNRAYKLYYSAPQVQVADFKGYDADEEDEVVDTPHVEVSQQAKEEPQKEEVATVTAEVKKEETDDLKDWLNDPKA